MLGRPVFGRQLWGQEGEAPSCLTPVGGDEFWGFARFSGGEGGIRTPDRLAPMPHFECGTINHSATSPRGRNDGPRPVRLWGCSMRGFPEKQGGRGGDFRLQGRIMARGMG